MTAAVFQGVMVNTMDTDIWVDLPTRQYIRLRVAGESPSTRPHLKSRKAIMRDKDVAHIPHLERVLKARKKLETKQ